jgi:hypothetical protein
MILARRHIPEPTLASVADDRSAREGLSASARLHLETCDRCLRLMDGHARAGRLLRSEWRLVTAEEVAASRPLVVVRPRIGAGSVFQRSPAVVRSWLLIALIVGILIAIGTGVLFLVGSRDGLAVDDTLVFGRGGQLFATDPDGGAETGLGPGTGPVWSPDKSHIAFTVAPQQPQGGLEDEAWVMARDGTDRRRLASGVAGPLVWSPTGDAILVAYPTFEILPIDGGHPTDLGMGPWKDSGTGSWAPDGSRIALVHANDLLVVDLARIDAVPRVLRHGGNPWLVHWSPDGSTIAYVADEAIHLVRPDGTGDRRLLSSLSPDPCALEWAPDSQHLAYVARTPGCPVSGPNVGVMVVDALTGESKAVFRPIDHQQVLTLAWAPDGHRLVLGTGPAPNCGVNPVTGVVQSGSRVGIWIVDAGGSGPREILPLSQADCEPNFDW